MSVTVLSCAKVCEHEPSCIMSFEFILIEAIWFGGDLFRSFFIVPPGVFVICFFVLHSRIGRVYPKKILGVGPSKNCVYKFSPDYYTATGLSSQGRMSSSVKMSMNRHQDTPKIKEDLTPARHVYDSRNKRHLGPTASRLNKESSSLLCKRHSAPIYDTLSCKFCYIFGLG